MAYQHKDGSGTLFRNDKKTKDNQPDYRGSATIDDKPRVLAAWIKENSAGKKYLSFKVEDAPEESTETTAQQNLAAFGHSSDDVEVPF